MEVEKKCSASLGGGLIEARRSRRRRRGRRRVPPLWEAASLKPRPHRKSTLTFGKCSASLGGGLIEAWIRTGSGTSGTSVPPLWEAASLKRVFGYRGRDRFFASGNVTEIERAVGKVTAAAAACLTRSSIFGGPVPPQSRIRAAGSSGSACAACKSGPTDGRRARRGTDVEKHGGLLPALRRSGGETARGGARAVGVRAGADRSPQGGRLAEVRRAAAAPGLRARPVRGRAASR